MTKSSDRIKAPLKEGQIMLTEVEAKELLSERGLSAPAGETVQSSADAVKTAEQIGYPVTVKVVSPSIQHKSEWFDGSGVNVNVTDPERVRTTAKRILDTADQQGIDAAVLVEEGLDLTTGIEVIVGGIRDPSFGSIVLVGLGGIMVEVLQDTSHRLAPISTAEALEMISELEAAPLFDGYRGSPAINKNAISEVIVTVGELLDTHEEIREIEINPLLAQSDRVVVLDALVALDGDTK
ncbi:acetate--CoA ligase family protein [Natrialbaceae archaeon A-CW1-1]